MGFLCSSKNKDNNTKLTLSITSACCKRQKVMLTLNDINHIDTLIETLQKIRQTKLDEDNTKIITQL